MNDDFDDILISRMLETVSMSNNEAKQGGLPFAAMVIDEFGNVLGRGIEQIQRLNDPTAYAETQAVKEACLTVGSIYLEDNILITSAEPHALAYTSALFARVSKIYFAVDRKQLAQYGVYRESSYQIFSLDPYDWLFSRVHQLKVPGYLTALDIYKKMNAVKNIDDDHGFR
ncbi:nucleoside deaminase [Moraxella osloensis]|nr:hypothetical protein [Moraxella osloensis]MBW4018385.1 nucleoside deaminase [Moraxella osloensis]